jgi:hypothetical protein
MLIEFCDMLCSDVNDIYLDSANASKARVYIGGNLVAVSTSFEYNEVYNMYRINLFRDSFQIPLSATNCNPFQVDIAPSDPDLPIPKVWLDVTQEGKHRACNNLTSFHYTLLDGQCGKLVASVGGEYRFLVPEMPIKDTSFANEQEARIKSLMASYEASFKAGPDHFVRFFAYGFAKSLPYINEREAAAMSLVHEKEPFMDCLQGIWKDYQQTGAYKKTLKM